MNRLIAFVGVLAVVVVGYVAVNNETANTDIQDRTQISELSSAVEPTLGFIDDARIKNAESEPGNWLSFGRTYEEQRHSPLTQINRESVDGLGLAWYKDMGTNRAQEATPIVVDGIMFFTSSWSRVYAIDARTGEELWMYDPKVPGEVARKACCDVVNRGVAVYKGRVYVGSLDGRLIAPSENDCHCFREKQRQARLNPQPRISP